jgi:hypothetical protein
MTQTHPITPPPELVQQWVGGAYLSDVHHNEEDLAYEQYIATRAAQWGADQELTECLRYASDNGLSATRMRETRRPKPPSLKEQALGLLNEGPVSDLQDHEVATIRRALEALPND